MQRSLPSLFYPEARGRAVYLVHAGLEAIWRDAMDPITALGVGAKAIDETSKVISGLERIMPWILVQPKEAAAELGSVITEVMKAPEVVNYAIDQLFGVIDEANPKLATLAQVGDGSLAVKVEKQRPHCHEIGIIAQRHLSQAFQNPLGPDAQELTNALRTLTDADSFLFEDLTKFAKSIQDVASQAANLAIQGKNSEALALLRRAASELFETRKRANELALRLMTMQTEFRRHALGLPPE
jgi:hypothetical protein